MKNIKFQFSVLSQGVPKLLEINLPFEDGLVYGGQYCPYDLHAHTITERPFHWYRAEYFVAVCDNQLQLASQLAISKSVIAKPSDGVIQAVKKTIEKLGNITFNRLIFELDCFSAIQYSFSEERDAIKVKNDYHCLAMYLIDCFPMRCVYGYPPKAIKESDIYAQLDFS
jgi:hypothetical protein